MESTMKRTKPEGMHKTVQDDMCKTPLKESKKCVVNEGTASNVSTGEKEKKRSKKQMKKVPMKGMFAVVSNQ